jgi:predicted nucleic acid-binding protein
MATKASDLAAVPGRVMLDASVLLAATDEGQAEHRVALMVLNDWAAGAAELCTSGQVLREYFTVATQPTEANGLGLSLPDALGNVRAIWERTTLLAEDARVADRLLGLVAEAGCRDKQVQDANLVATMLVHGIGTVVTAEPADYARFAGHVILIRL